MARMKRDEAETTPEPVDEQVIAPGGRSDAIPPGFEARTIVLPARFWVIFDRQAARGKMTVSKWLERILARMARD